MGASPRTLPMMIRETERNEAEAMPLRQTSSGRGWGDGAILLGKCPVRAGSRRPTSTVSVCRDENLVGCGRLGLR